MEQLPPLPKAHLSNHHQRLLVHTFTQGLSASAVATSYGIRKATVLHWYQWWRICFYEQQSASFADPASIRQWWLWLRWKIYQNPWKPRARSHAVLLEYKKKKIYAQTLASIDHLVPQVNDAVHDDITPYTYVFHKKHLDELIPVVWINHASWFAVIHTIPTAVHSFVQYAQTMIQKAHGVAEDAFPYHLAEWVERWNMQ